MLDNNKRKNWLYHPSALCFALWKGDQTQFWTMGHLLWWRHGCYIYFITKININKIKYVSNWNQQHFNIFLLLLQKYFCAVSSFVKYGMLKF